MSCSCVSCVNRGHLFLGWFLCVFVVSCGRVDLLEQHVQNELLNVEWDNDDIICTALSQEEN